MRFRLDIENKPALKQKVDLALSGARIFVNCTLYELFENHNYLKEAQKKDKDGNFTDEIIHFADFAAIGSVEYKHKMLEEYPILSNLPQGAITCKSGLIADMKKSLGKTPIEFQEPVYYSKKKPRNSYSYQETFNKIKFSDSKRVFHIDLAKVGLCKFRAEWKRIRFNEEGTIDFTEYCQQSAKEHKQVTVTVSKNNCGEYYICFKMPLVYKPMVKPTSESEVGVDLGVADAAICSDRTKYPNQHFARAEEEHLCALQRKLARQWGYANEEFRQARKLDKTVVPSSGYLSTDLKIKKLNNKIARKRENYNHSITTDIVSKNKLIAVETLDIQGMMDKDKKKSEEKPKDKVKNASISDVAMYQIKNQLSYKSGWYGRKLIAAGQYDPTTKRCHNCGYISDDKPTSIREWDCPNCGAHHDRDFNAADNILYYAKAANGLI